MWAGRRVVFWPPPPRRVTILKDISKAKPTAIDVAIAINIAANKATRTVQEEIILCTVAPKQAK